jgi:murein DD-endopeptidase MepM/ murein hydrolase activator NlpD
MSSQSDFLLFLRNYILSRGEYILSGLVIAKKAITSFLLNNRGKYSSHFINTSFLFLLSFVLISAPVIAENYQLIQGTLTDESNFQSSRQNEIALSDEEISVNTLRANSARDKVTIYFSVKGDTIKSIAEKFGISEKSISWANPGTSDPPAPGTRLRIAPVTGVVHTVVAGDNIYVLAKKYQINAQNIVNFPFNEFKDESFTLITGTELMIPGGSIIEPKAPVIRESYEFAQVVAGVRGSSSFIWPTNGIITQYPASYHMALDIANGSSPPVIAADAGTVIFSGCFSWGYGCHIIIDHNNGYRSLYGHLSRRDVEQGNTVSQGQQIGQMGSTGRSTGTHLHFEIRQGSTLLNPQNFLK